MIVLTFLTLILRYASAIPSTAAPGANSVVKCDPDDRIEIETEVFKSTLGLYCEYFHPNQAYSQVVHQTLFTFSWTGKPNCNALTCKEMYGKFLSDSSCHFNSHSMATNGEITFDCGTATYSLADARPPKPPPPPPPPPPPTRDTRYILHIHQEMERGNSFIEWDLWGAHNSKHISGPSRSVWVDGPTHRMQIVVTNPLNIDDTEVDVVCGGEKTPKDWPFGTGRRRNNYRDPNPRNVDHGKMPWPNRCWADLQAAQWRKKNAGYERDFTCEFNDRPCANWLRGCQPE